MDKGRNTRTAGPDNVNTEPGDGGTTGATGTVGETGSEGDTSAGGFFENVAALGGGTVVEEGGERPQRTLPPSVSVETKYNKDGTPRKRRGPKSASTNNGISPMACGAFIGGLFAGGSLLLTGNLSLAATTEETNELGTSLAACLDTIPESKTTKLIGTSAPWLRFIGVLGGSVLGRYQAVIQAQQRSALLQQQHHVAEPPNEIAPAHSPFDPG